MVDVRGDVLRPPHKPTCLFVYLIYSSTILNTFRFQKFAYGPLVNAWTTSHLQKNETVTRKYMDYEMTTTAFLRACGSLYGVRRQVQFQASTSEKCSIPKVCNTVFSNIPYSRFIFGLIIIFSA